MVSVQTDLGTHPIILMENSFTRWDEIERYRVGHKLSSRDKAIIELVNRGLSYVDYAD